MTAKPPAINDAKELAYKLRCSGVMVLAFGGFDGRYGAASYGMTRAKCDAMGKVLNRIMELIENGTIEVPEELE